MLKQESIRTGCAPIYSHTTYNNTDGNSNPIIEGVAKKLARVVVLSFRYLKVAEAGAGRIPALPVCRSSFIPSLPVAAAFAILLTLSSAGIASAQTPNLASDPGSTDEGVLFKSYRTDPTSQEEIRAKSFWEPAGTFRANQAGNQKKQPAGKSFFRTKSSKPGIYTEPNRSVRPSFPSETEAPLVIKTVDPPSSNYAKSILEKGGLLESEFRWNEALAVYQEGLKKAPNDSQILAHRQLARIHVNLASRLADKTYIKSVKTDSADYANSAFEEILSYIQGYHYAQPDWNKMVQHGILNLTEAMKNNKFQKAFAPEGYELTYQGVVKQLLDHKKDIFVKNRDEYVRIVRTIARLAETKCGLKQSVTIYEFSCSSISALDTYSSYMGPESFKDMRSRLHGHFVGIGVEIHITDSHLDVVKVFPGGPADDARIRSEDKILAVNGHRVDKVGGNQAADLLKGVEGSQLTVLVETPDKKEYLLRMKRRHIEVSSISKAEIVDAKNGVGYIQLNSFQDNSVYEFDSAMMKLHRQGMKSLVLDLRDNPGGVLKVSIDLANRFLQNGKIVTTRGRSPADNAVYHAKFQGTWNIPLVVLIDENSASASEILAAAIADNRRGHVVGKRSYGKGSVQGIFPLVSGRGGLRLTTAKFFSPNGRAISLQGVSPTKQLETVAKVNTNKEDVKKKVIFGSKDDKVLAASVRLVSRNQRQPSSQNLGIHPSRIPGIQRQLSSAN